MEFSGRVGGFPGVADVGDAWLGEDWLGGEAGGFCPEKRDDSKASTAEIAATRESDAGFHLFTNIVALATS